MILHSIPEKWANPLSDFISMLQQASNSTELPSQHLSLLLEILTVLPEEVVVFAYFLHYNIYVVFHILLIQFQSMRLSHERKVSIRVELLKAVKDGNN